MSDAIGEHPGLAGTGARFCYSLPLRRRTVVDDDERTELPDDSSQAEVDLGDPVYRSA
jgi:hypothetical protein